jgi:hypothetical protein
MATTRRQYGPPYPFDAVISGIGVMLEPAADGAPSWIEKSIEFFQGDVQLNADDRGYVQFPPEVELPNAWTDFSEGYGIAEQGTGTRFRKRYHYALYADCSTGRPIKGPKMNAQQTLTITSGTKPSQVIEFNGFLYLIVGDKIFRRDDDTSVGWAAVTLPGTIAGKTIGKCAVFRGTQANNFLFVPIGAADFYYVMNTAETFFQHASQEATHFEVVGDQLWLANTESNQQVIRASDDGGTTATWTGITIVGDGARLITWMETVQDRLMVMREDGVFGPSDDADVLNEDLTAGLRPLANAENGKGSVSWSNQLLVFKFGEMLWKYSPDTGVLEQFGPETVEQNASEVKGPVRAIAAHGNQALYAGIYNSSNNRSYLMRYGTYHTEDTSNGPEQQFMKVWHGALFKWGANERIDHMHTTNLTASPRLYCFLNASATTLKVQYMVLPRTSNPADDPNYRFDTVNTGEVYLPRYHGNFPFETKLLKAIGVGGRNLDSGRSVGAEYKLASATEYTSLGTTTEEGGERLEPAGSPTSTAFDLKATIATSSDSSTPVLGSFVVYTALRTNTGLKRITASIRVRDNVLDKKGMPLRDSYENLLTDLESAVTTLGSINVINPRGETVAVIGINFSHAMLGYDDKGAPIWTLTAEMIQTRVSYTRGTWARAAAYTWGALATLTWQDMRTL